MFCEKCGKELKEDDIFCTNCGNKVGNKHNFKNKKYLYIVIGIVVVVIVIVTMLIINNSKSSKEEINDLDTQDSNIEPFKEITRIDDTIDTGMTYNFTLKDVEERLMSACDECNTNRYTPFKQTAENRYNTVYSSYAFENEENSNIITVQTHNGYVTILSYGYSNSQITFSEGTGKEVFYTLINKLFEEDYANKITNTFDNLSFNQIKYFENLLITKIDTTVARQLTISPVTDEYNEKININNNETNIEQDSNNETDFEQNSNSENNKHVENSNNSNTNSSLNSSNNSTSSKDSNMVFIPMHSYGEQLENYTKELDKREIKYKIVKKEDWSYQNNAVIEVDYEGETVEKGTIVTITVADNIYLDIFTDKEYMLKLADLENANKQLSVSISINGNNVYNGNLPENGEICKLTYKNKLDNNLKLSITINGKSITKEIKYRYVADDYSRPYILIREGGDVGEG